MLHAACIFLREPQYVKGSEKSCNKDVHFHLAFLHLFDHRTLKFFKYSVEHPMRIAAVEKEHKMQNQSSSLSPAT